MAVKLKAKYKRKGKPRPGYTTCPDCGAEYKLGAPHGMFCRARTCEQCGTSFTGVIVPNETGERLCDECQYGMDEDDEFGEEEEY